LKITNNLNGAKVTRIQTLTKYLDSVNFIDGNPDADPTQELPREVWLVDRKSTESRELLLSFIRQDHSRGYPTAKEWNNLITEVKDFLSKYPEN
jgi:lambda family phage minor tail protein L